MRSDLLERLMKISARTGERHVLVDASLPEPVVVMPLAAYEELVTGRPAVQMPVSVPMEPPETWQEEPAASPISDSVPEVKESLNEEEKFYLEPID